MALVALRGVEKECRPGQSRVKAPRRVDPDVAACESVAVWGVSGRGKASLLGPAGRGWGGLEGVLDVVLEGT
jgi:predicted ABC-type transport system involved in lysophospholipase L1 biosynthesis ATPase subunit